MRAILICPNEDLKQKFTEAVAQHPNVVLSKILDEYPAGDHLRRVICLCAPEIVFLDLEDAPAAETVARYLEKEFPTIQRVALHRSQDPAIFRRVLQLRMRELLSPPFDYSETGPFFDRLQEELRAHPATIGATEHLYAFLPAKAGTGASTIAANATWAFGQIPDKKVLLADFDTSSGVTGFMFNVEHEYGLKDAAAHGRDLDDETWNRVVRSVGNIDLLLSGAPHVGEAISGQQLTRLIEFSRRNYDVIGVDLSDSLNETSVAVLREANQIFLVTTPELPSLRMARLKALLLQKLELFDKVSLLVNRATKRMELDLEEIEKTVGLPVFMSFPCDYANVSKAIQNGQPATKLSGAAHEFAEKLLKAAPHKPDKKRFIEQFAILPLRYGFR
jgi:pilus assembly protein CpaE